MSPLVMQSHLPGRLINDFDSRAMVRFATLATRLVRVNGLLSTHQHRLGAYGIRITGLEEAAELLVEVDEGAPAYAIRAEIGSADGAPVERVDDDGARLRLQSGGEIVIDRAARTVVYRVPHDVRPDELVHPYLAPAAAVIGRWLGRESVHAGAFAVDGRALGVVGTRESGKSSTLAWLARQGIDVLCDDMLIVDGDRPFAGPRSIDLRADAAQRLDAGEAIGVTGARERWRLALGTTTSGRTRLVGWVFLAWGDETDARPLPARERIPRIAEERGLRLTPVRPDSLLELAELPAWELSRPRDWASLPRAASLLLELASATPTGAA
jgi:hypothetical protein